MTLGESIRTYREAAEMSQAQLGAVLSISPQAISKWERNESMPDAAYIPALAEALHVSTDRLFGRESMTVEDVEYAILRYMRGLPREARLPAIRQIAYFSEHVLMGSDPHSDYFQRREWDVSGCSHSVCNEREEGFTFSSNRSTLPFYSLFLEPSSGWKSIFQAENPRPLFEALGNPDVLDALFTLYEHKTLSFDEAYALKALGIQEPHTVLTQLETLRILWHEHCTINGSPIRIWHFRAQCGLIALLAVANEYLYHHQQFELQSDRRTSPYFPSKNA